MERGGIRHIAHTDDGTSIVTVIGADHRDKQVTVLTSMLNEANLREVLDAVANPTHPLRTGPKQSAKDKKGPK